jgi:hypothetical protein
MPSPTDFNLSPYYDDFNESKKFHRILFRPAFAVQARELTQSQTILQNQIEKLGDHFFEKGAMVIPGEIGYDLNYYAVKLTSIDITNTLSDFTDGTVLTGSTSGITATIVNRVATDGTDPDTLYVKYNKSGGANKNIFAFADGETITGTNSDLTAVSAIVDTTATGCAAQVQEGTYYINGFLVSVTNQTIILDKYTNTPSYRVGLIVTESFITPNQDNSLNDNAQGVSNTNAPGAHRFKIDLTLTKKTIASNEDANFVELLRLSNGILQNQVRTTEYAVLEDTFARRTFDESGDYTVRDFDLDLREHLISGNNRGIYTAANGGLESKIAAGLSPGKAYVQGYEIETIGTSFVDINKARSFNTQNAFQTNFDVGNYVNVTNIYGTPDVGPVSGETDAFKKVDLYNVATSSRGTGNAGSGVGLNAIGRAKSKGFEYKSGSATANIYSSASLTSSVYKHYLFDINMFTHLNITTAQTFTTGEEVTGSTSGAKGTVESLTAVESIAVDSISIANPGVVTISAGHNFKEGQQITLSGTYQVDSGPVTSAVYTVRNPNATTFELYDTDGTTSIDVTGFTSASAAHGVVVLSSVNGTFIPGETIVGGSSSNIATIQSDAVGYNGVKTFDFSATKQIYMAGTAPYTSDTTLDSSNTDNVTITGTLDIGSGSASVIGINTKFTTELRIGDSISFTNDSGNTETKLVEAIISDTSLTLTSVTAAASTKTIATRRRAQLQDANKNISIFKLPYRNIKTLKTASNSNITDTSFSVRRQFIVTLSGGSGQITAGTNEAFPSSASDADYVISVDEKGGSSTAGETGDTLTSIGNNHESNPIFSQPSGTGTVVFDFGANYANSKIKILATVNRSTAGSKTKTLRENQTKDITSLADAVKQGGINLGRTDIFQLVSVSMATAFGAYSSSGAIDITSRYELDNGQRDNYYDVGRIKLKSGELEPTGSLRITFDHFEHGNGDYFDVDSYSGVIDYANIPVYKSDTTGQTFQLRDCLDFRPQVAYDSTINSGGQDRDYDTTNNATTVDVVKFGSSITADFEYYLPRIDKIFLDKEGNFKVIEGASSLNPQVPKILDGAMHLYTLEIPAYTLSTEDITIKKVDNKRYTMRDIGKLESRIENLEYYTQLSLLETQAQNLQIQDAEGFDRFKNGFVVDNFTGHGIGDVGNVDYAIAMDMAKGELRPMFNEDAVKLIERDEDGTAIIASDRVTANYAKTGDLITLPYTETTIIDQPYASKTLNVNPFDVFTWSGSVKLTPPSDEWKETERAPELTINNVGAFDTLASNLGNEALNGFEIGTVWNDWQDFWTGAPRDVSSRDTSGALREGRRVFVRTETTTEQTVSQTRTGVRQRIVPQVVRNSIGDRIINVAFVPFIRSRTLTFEATRMKPNTRVYAFFDNIDISSYITPSSGANLETDNNGAVSGTFTIPSPTVDSNPRWRTGTRVFRLTSSQTDARTDVETSAEADYVARGILETVQNTIISTREPQIVRVSTADTRSIVRTSTRASDRTIGWVDPLAQTFLIDDTGGVFVTSLDIYFASKDSNIPVTLQIREVVNGYPGKTILPFSEKTLNPSSVNISDNATTATTFTFDSPVYLQENTEYCFVLLANSNNYTAYVARLGETVIGSDRTISQQPYAGVLFKSQNGSTWTAEQNEDIKFKMKRAEFSNVTGTLTLTNDALPTRTLKNNPLRTLSDSSPIIRVFHPNHGMHGTNNNVTIAGVPNGGSLNGLTAAQINGTYTQISNVTLDSYDINPADNVDYTLSISNPTVAGDIGGTSVTATQNRLYDVLNLNISTMTVPGTNLTYSIRPTTGRSIHGSETEFNLTASANSEPVVANDNIYFNAPQMVASSINETSEMAGSKSLFVNCTLTTSNTKLSPVIDLQRVSAFTIQNRLNIPTAGNTVNFVSCDQNTGTSCSSKYITKPIILENISSALDVRLTQNVRATSSVQVFYRVTSSEEVRNIGDLNWTPFNGDGSEDITVTPAEDNETFREYKYSALGINDFTAFQIKIVMKGTNSAYPPIIRDLRGIALAV